MSSSICSQGMVLATAMALSGTVILLAFRLQKSFPQSLIPPSSRPVIRSCISSEGKKMKKNKKKRVHFAEDVVEPRGNGEEFRRQHSNAAINAPTSTPSNLNKSSSTNGDMLRKYREMPANRVALYNGILRDRVVLRMAYSC